MAKVNFKELLLAKGEKGLLVLGAVGLGGMLVWSLAAAFGGPDSPSVTVKKMTDQSQRITSQIGSESVTDIVQLPPWVTKSEGFMELDSKQYALHSSPFEPTTEPSRLRDQPVVLTPVPYELGGGAQLTLIRAPMPAYDVKIDNGKVTIGVLATVKVNANDNKVMKDFRNNAKNKANTQQNRPPQQPPGGFPGSGGAPGGFGGAPGGGFPGGNEGAGPGGGPGGGRGGMMGGGRGGMMGGGMGGMMGAGGMASANRTESFVKYVTPEEFDKNPSYVPAVTVYPLRMLSVQMAFPLKQQFEEIRKALKLQTLSEAVAMSNYSSPQGLFAGIEVERRIIMPDGTEFEWAKFDHENTYRNTILNRKLGDVEDDGYASYYTLPAYQQRLAAPYPILAEGLGNYETISLNCIAESIEKLKALNRPKLDREKNKFEGGDQKDNPYMPSSGGVGAAQGAGMFSGGGIGSGQGPSMGFSQPPPSGMGGGGFKGMGGDRGGPGSSGMRPPGGAGMQGAPGGATGGSGMRPPGGSGMQPPPGGAAPGGSRPGKGGAGAGGASDAVGPGGAGGGMAGVTGGNGDPKFYPLNEDFLLIRFLDPEINPGYGYQYRIRVIMKNPNLGKDSLVSQPGFAKNERIEGPWWTVPNTATIPPETYFYAINPKSYEKKVKEKFEKSSAMQELLLPKDGKTVVQVHEWASEVKLNANAGEPIGTWIIGEAPVGPGEFIGRKQLVQLPTWSAERSAYALKELPGNLGLKPPSREKPKGWLVDLTTAAVMVDFEGGKFRGQVNNNSVQDESDVEMLVVLPDGSVAVRNSAADEEYPPRKNRTKEWDEWLKKAEEQGNRMSQPNGAGSPGSFGRPGSGGGGAGPGPG